ncbi:MAG: SDR family oxidoreductase [Desulfobacterales bacterium]|nr:SDR family oxidoreductase [Desulfobacterales bacterium]
MKSALDLFKLDGKVAMVTGGSKGIGMFYSEALADAGAYVAVADIDRKTVAETTERLNRKHPDSILGIQMDVSSRDSIREAVKKIDQRWGRLDILVNNAALFAVIQSRDTPWSIPDEEFDRVMAVNVRGIYSCTAEALALMQRNHWGRVINIASGLAFKGSARLMHYAASKGAVVTLTRSMAMDLGDKGITVNALAPGGTSSPTFVEIHGENAMRAKAMINSRCIKREELPEDLVGTMLYLASSASDFLTGQTIVVNGGDYLH